MINILMEKFGESLNLSSYLFVSWDSLLLARSEIYAIGFLIYQTFFFSFLILALLITFTLVGSIFSTREIERVEKFKLKLYKPK